MIDPSIPMEPDLQIAGSIKYASCFHISAHKGRLFIFDPRFNFMAVCTPEEAVTFFLNPPAYYRESAPERLTGSDLLSSLGL